MKRQSSAVWFQPASCDSASAASASAGCIGRTRGWVTLAASVAPIADLVVGRLVEGRHGAREPVGGPLDHGEERHPWIAELGIHEARIVEPARRALAAEDARRAPEESAAGLRELSNADGLRPCHVEGARRC